MTLLLEELPGRPDRNTPDARVAVDETVIVYGFKEGDDLFHLNGKEGFVIEDTKDGWFLCAISGFEEDFYLKHENLMIMDEEDLIVINAYDGYQ